MEFVYKGPEGRRYPGPEISYGGENYPVITEGSRDLIRGVPASAADQLALHNWFSTGAAEADIVEVAAREAIKEQSKVDYLKRALAEAEKTAAHARAQADDIAKQKALEADAAAEAVEEPVERKHGRK